ncbi:carboxyl transferase domain-containing protein [Albimonas sp. CAU 1670]|uniref:acetyl-CoA carboxylase family protein n=1 Tax=Albimonas sp. CAU 1670 TaxID=3032599 RepID=UPI0023DC3DA6|nr:carboxyl transferase domain-containing protein [Albimonas sp. CAU 1670]MDF2233978.1 carboxyl transferase domain-containing protein [Albimonas sp. CAU 1670]
MPIRSILIANRGEIAIRIARAAADLGLKAVALASADDAEALHARAGDAVRALPGTGPAAYLDIEAVIAAAQAAGCDAVHPGYGFLSENAAFAARCAEAGLVFIGPSPEVLSRLGDKSAARALAAELDVPLLPGLAGGASEDAVRAFVEANGPTMIKAVVGGGGRGMRAVETPAQVAEAYARCASEAAGAFGDGALYAEKLVKRARHIEVQVIGDGEAVVHAWERDCTLQRQGQKLVEIAPAPDLAPALREAILSAALRIAGAVGYRGLGTFEFLVDLDDPKKFHFMEANPRLQVEHTVTEEVTGLDLVATQILLLGGESLASLGLSEPPALRPGYAVQLRVNAETMTPTGESRPQGGTLALYEPPTGPGVRVDGQGFAGMKINPRFDSLLAKLIVRSAVPGFPAAIARAARALGEFRIAGVQTNAPFLAGLLARPEVARNEVHTSWVKEIAGAVIAGMAEAPAALPAGLAAEAAKGPAAEGPEGTAPLPAPLTGVLASLEIAEGAAVAEGQAVAILEAMKMEHVVTADAAGIVRALAAKPGEALVEGDPILWIEPSDAAGAAVVEAEEIDLDAIRPDLAAVIERHARGLDENRPKAVERRRSRNQRTARENLDQLCDPGSFTEYGALALAAQRQRRSMEELIDMAPADGLVAGIGTVNADLYGPERTQIMAMAYDFTVFAGTQGWMNHKKKDRLLELAHRLKLPLVLYGEGGGGRPGETDGLMVHGLDTPSFRRFADLSGEVPMIAVVSGFCFAGNAALVGCCDVIVATKNACIGMGGPAMVEGGGLGVYAPNEIGPVSTLAPIGAVDLVVEDEEAATEMTRRLLSYVQGPAAHWEAADQRLLRWKIPENRRRAYDVREVIETLADKDSVIEMKPDHAPGMVTALIRIEGRAMGLVANDTRHLGGAVDAEGARKSGEFLKLCDRWGLPVLSLCDTPGFMVGPEAEAAGQMRASAALFTIASKLTVPLFTVVLRKGYGLGAQSMAAGGFHAPVFTVAWPTGEFGGMGLEGAVRLGYRREMEAIEDPEAREAFYQEKLAHLYEVGKATTMAGFLEIDAVIDPAETRAWVTNGLRAAAVEARDFHWRPGRAG